MVKVGDMHILCGGDVSCFKAYAPASGTLSSFCLVLQLGTQRSRYINRAALYRLRRLSELHLRCRLRVPCKPRLPIRSRGANWSRVQRYVSALVWVKLGSRQAGRGGLGAPNGHTERNAGPWTARVRRPVSLYIRSETALPLPARRRLRVLHTYEGHSPVLTILNSPP